MHALVAQRMRTPFAWGVHDCCLWAADAVRAQTGVDPAQAWRGRYGTAREALRLLAELGGLRAVAAAAGEPIAPMAAREGDIGLLQRPDRELLAVCAGEVWLAPGPTGLVPVPLSAATAAWRVSRG